MKEENCIINMKKNNKIKKKYECKSLIAHRFMKCQGPRIFNERRELHNKYETMGMNEFLI